MSMQGLDKMDPITTFNHNNNSDGQYQQQQFEQKLDEAKFGLFHIRTILVSGVGFFCDAYDLFAITMVAPMLGVIYGGGKLDPATDGWLKASAAWGTLIGQLLFGFLSDKLGRKSMYGIVLMIIIAGTIGSTLSGSTQAVSTVAMLALWRLFLGIGVGGDYPLSGVITSEFANSKHRGLMIAAVFAMQGVGIMASTVVAVIVLAAFKQQILENPVYYLDLVWRLCIGVGAIPALIAVYFRLQIPESPRFSADVLGNTEKALADANQVVAENANNRLLAQVNTYNDSYERKPLPSNNNIGVVSQGPSFTEFFGQWKNLKVLIGASVTWFALDVGFYGTNLNTAMILDAFGFGKGANPFESMWNVALGNLIIALCGAVPGYWVTVFTVEKLGRKPIQYFGFAALIILFGAMAACFDTLKQNKPVFIFVYCLIQFFNNFGPNATTFIIAAEVFPTRFRTTAHGIAAASGKAGAILAAQGFSLLKDYGGAAGSGAFVYGLLWIFCGFMILGLIFTVFVPETKGKTLDELSKEM